MEECNGEVDGEDQVAELGERSGRLSMRLNSQCLLPVEGEMEK